MDVDDNKENEKILELELEGKREEAKAKAKESEVTIGKLAYALMCFRKEYSHI